MLVIGDALPMTYMHQGIDYIVIATGGHRAVELHSSHGPYLLLPPQRVAKARGAAVDYSARRHNALYGPCPSLKCDRPIGTITE
jgi:hypothetical protein